MTQYPTYQQQTTTWPTVTAVPDQERSLGTLAHVIPIVAMIASAGLLGFVASLVFYVMANGKPFARTYAANSLNIQIMVAIGSAISWLLTFVLIGFLTLPMVLTFGFVLHVIAAVKANRGELWTPPMTPRFVR